MPEKSCCQSNSSSECSQPMSAMMYNCDIDVFKDVRNAKLTGVVCTIGPACDKKETVIEMIKAGMNIARFNFSHGNHEMHKKMMDMVKDARATMPESPISLALDTKGPEIRTGLNKDGSNITLVKGSKVILTEDERFKEACTSEKIYIDLPSFTKCFDVGQIILLADGNVVLRASVISGQDVHCDIISGTTFGSRKNVCLPMVKTDLPALSTKDISDIKFGLEQKVDIIFASFIRSASNVKEIRNILNGHPHGKFVKIVSKIENYEGIHNIVEVIKESDGIMVARGDLGMDLALERVILAQKKIIALCNKLGRPVINATQMLESMINSYRPTRAEVSDVTNAVLDGADAVMLSGESANGQYPVDAVKFMSKICLCAETMNRTKELAYSIHCAAQTENRIHSSAPEAVMLSYKNNCDAILVVDDSGSLAISVSLTKPNCPVLCVSCSEEIVRGWFLYRALSPVMCHLPCCQSSGDCKDLNMKKLQLAIDHGFKRGSLKDGSSVVVVLQGETPQVMLGVLDAKSQITFKK